MPGWRNVNMAAWRALYDWDILDEIVEKQGRQC